MGLYLENGYVNIAWVLSKKQPFNFIWGGRGTGKTFGALEYAYMQKIKFLFVRRTQTQCDLINKPDFNPFKSLCNFHGWDIGTAAITKYNSGFYNMEQVNDKATPTGAPIGYTAALSTFSNIRGFDASDIDLIIFDEFIPERHEKPLKHEADAFFNMVETVNRNRELQGKNPVQVLCLANSNDLANPLFMSLKIVRKAEAMTRDGQKVSLMQHRGLALFNLCDSPISEQKADTALYRLTEGSNFANMSIGNQFNEDRGRIRPAPLKEYKPEVIIGELCIYVHKSNGTIYITEHVSGNPPSYSIGEADTRRFTKRYQWVWFKYLQNDIEFEDYGCEILFSRYFKGVR